MGEPRQDRRDPVGGGTLTGPAARVVPNVPSFSVDDGFWYSVPDHLHVQVGSQVRVPLGGRRVRGWVVELSSDREGRLKDISGISGEVPVFDGGTLRSLIWASQHYVAPLSVVLAKASPPNLPKGTHAELDAFDARTTGHVLQSVAKASADGKKTPTTAVVGRWQSLDWLEALGPVLLAGRSVLVVAATAAEVDVIHSRARDLFGDRAVAVPVEGDAAITRAWEQAQTPGRLMVGPPRLASWMVAGVGLAVVLEEGRRAMKDRQTPTIHVRELLRTRSRIEGFNVVFFGPTPGVELLAAGASMVRSGHRPWGLVEVVDRSHGGGGFLTDQVYAALKSVVATPGERAFILTGHQLAPRIVEEANRRLGAGSAAVHPDPATVGVGTERDLAGLDPVSLTVAADVDFMLHGTGYRASEEALRQLARLGNALREGRGRRMMVQTSDPDSSLILALKRADPIPYLEEVLVERARLGVPPAVEMLAVEVRGQPPEGVETEIASLEKVAVFGPMATEEGRRWLITGDLTKVRKELRSMTSRWREKGATVRIDADPIDF